MKSGARCSCAVPPATTPSAARPPLPPARRPACVPRRLENAEAIFPDPSEFPRIGDLHAWTATYYAEGRAFLDAVDGDALTRKVVMPWANELAKQMGRMPDPPTLAETMVQITSHSDAPLRPNQHASPCARRRAAPGGLHRLDLVRPPCGGASGVLKPEGPGGHVGIWKRRWTPAARSPRGPADRIRRMLRTRSLPINTCIATRTSGRRVD